MIILLDQDGVLADFEHAFIDAWRARHPDIAPVAFEDRKSFYIREDYAPELRGMAEAIYTAPGFIRNLPPVPATHSQSRRSSISAVMFSEAMLSLRIGSEA